MRDIRAIKAIITNLSIFISIDYYLIGGFFQMMTRWKGGAVMSQKSLSRYL